MTDFPHAAILQKNLPLRVIVIKTKKCVDLEPRLRTTTRQRNGSAPVSISFERGSANTETMEAKQIKVCRMVHSALEVVDIRTVVWNKTGER